MKTIRTGPYAVVFTLASDAGEDEILQTARDVFRRHGIRMRGMLELEAFRTGAGSVVFASCRHEPLFRFDSITDAALRCHAVPGRLYRYRGSYYIEASPRSGLDRCAAVPDRAERRAVLDKGQFLADNIIEKIQSGAK